MLQKLRGAGIAFLLIVLPCYPAAWAGGGTASDAVSAFQKDLLVVMKQGAALGLRGRYGKLRPVIERSFHLPIMVTIATGPYWAQGSRAQKEAVIKAFHRMSASTLATFFDSYDGETFEVVRERPGSRTTVLVDTRVIRRAKDPVEITYVVGNYGGRWWMVDVIVSGGISELTVRRSEYLSVLKSGGLDALVARLNDTADKILAKVDKPMGASALR